MSPAIERRDPPYMQVVKHIRDQILSGDLPEGSTVPSARQITKDWKISLATATKVLAALRSEGLVRAIVGVGTVVLPVPSSPQHHLLSMRRTGRIYRPGDHARILSAELISAPNYVAESLVLPPGASVIRRRRITLRGDRPLSLSTSWLDGSLANVAPLLLLTERLKQGTPSYIQQVTGRRAIRGRDDVTARLATEEEVTHLAILPGSAVLQGSNIYLDEEGEVIEFGEYIAPGDLGWSYEYQVSD